MKNHKRINVKLSLVILDIFFRKLYINFYLISPSDCMLKLASKPGFSK